MQIILASHNKHKQEELRSILTGFAECILLDENFPDIDETGATLDANAYLKAKAVFEHYRKPSLADDTGLEVTALDGAPGVRTARYAGENATYEDNCNKLLQQLIGVQNRKAVFRTSLCYISEDGEVHFFEGNVFGIISGSPRGSNGFGYDPVFIPQDNNPENLTFAEMTTEQKNTLSHRSRALDAFMKWLTKEPIK
jgi:XTP/dITP diphosphohydrolase